MTETPKITIPEDALAAATDALSGGARGDKASRRRALLALAAAAPFLVAAELERLADDLPGLWKRSGGQYASGRSDAAAYLRNRAADLRGVSGVSADGGEKTDE